MRTDAALDIAADFRILPAPIRPSRFFKNHTSSIRLSMEDNEVARANPPWRIGPISKRDNPMFANIDRQATFTGVFVS